jgi:hypothetical protein
MHACKQLANFSVRLPGKAAGQGCRARLSGKAAGQGCHFLTYSSYFSGHKAFVWLWNSGMVLITGET